MCIVHPKAEEYLAQGTIAFIHLLPTTTCYSPESVFGMPSNYKKGLEPHCIYFQ